MILGMILLFQLVSLYFISNTVKGIKVKKDKPDKIYTSATLIEKSLGKGKIDLDQAAFLKAQSLLEPEKLPPEYRGKPSKDGTFILREAKLRLRKIKNRSIKNKLGKMLRGLPISQISGFGNLTKTYYTENFSIHYTTKSSDSDKVPTGDTNANSIPDIVELTGRIFENVWNREINTLGYMKPPGDAVKYNVFMQNLVFAYGYTYGEAPSSLEPAPSFIVIENDFAGFPGTRTGNIQVTAAHEFFHAIQFGYNSFISDWSSSSSGANTWWMEATATWMEDEIYPNVNDYLNYQYIYAGYNAIDGWFAYPHRRLTVFNGLHEYGSMIYAKYLSEKKGGAATIKSIWDKTTNYDFSVRSNRVEELIDQSLRELPNTSLRATFTQSITQFSRSNYSLSYLDKYYMLQKRKSEWPLYRYNLRIDKILRAYPRYSLKPSNPPSYTGTNYIVLFPESGAGQNITIYFKGGTSTTNSQVSSIWSVRAIQVNSSGTSVTKTIVSSGQSTGKLRFYYFGNTSRVRRIILIVTVLGTKTNGIIDDPPRETHRFNYTYTIR